MITQKITNSNRHLVLIALISWLSMLGFDVFLHAGLLARLYLEPGPFLLPPLEAFKRIPLGYLSFLLLAILLLWLMIRLKIAGWLPGLRFGMKLGILVWGSETLGLLSISTANITLMAGWFVGQTLELAIAGAVMGSALGGASLGRLFLKMLGFIIIALVTTVILQTLGIAPAARL